MLYVKLLISYVNFGLLNHFHHFMFVDLFILDRFVCLFSAIIVSSHDYLFFFFLIIEICFSAGAGKVALTDT